MDVLLRLAVCWETLFCGHMSFWRSGGGATQFGELKNGFNVFLYVMILDGHSPVEKISPEVAGKSLFLKSAGVSMEVIL